MKKYCLNILLACSFLTICEQAFAQGLSNRGRDFWVGYGHHQFMEAGQTNTQEMVLYLSAEQAANVTVRIEGTAWVRNYAVPANSVIISDLIPKAGAIDARLISLPCSFVPPGTPCGGEGVFSNKGIHITSDVPIVAYAHIYGSTSSGATMLMPVDTWGYSYVTLNSKQNYATNCFSWAYAIAQHDNTVVEITPTAATRGGRAANAAYTVTLNRGEIYQLMAGPEAGSAKPELSGTKIRSVANGAGQCYPIAVFAGSSRTSNPMSCGSGGGDNDNQQCFPSQAWGKRYLTAPTSNSTTASSPMYNTYKIVVKDPSTQVRRNGTLLALTPPNNFYEFNSNEPEYITADKPIMVAQYMTGGSTCQGGGGLGDPEMMYISPVEQGIKRIGFYRNDEESIQVNYLTLIIPTAGVSSLTIDGSNTFTHTYPHPKLPGYTIVIKRWTGAKAQAVAQSDSAFTAITYGLGSQESYGYNAGTLINNLSAIGSIYNTSDTSTSTTSHPFTCIKTPVKLSVLLGYATPPVKLVWQLSQVGGGISPNVDVTDNAPTPAGTVIVEGIPYFKFELPGDYTFTTPGSFRVPILATHPSIENCTNTEEVSYYVEVKDRPVADFSFTHSGCVLDPVQFAGQAAASNGFAINQWLWTFPDATTGNTQNTMKLFTATGAQNVLLKVVSTEGCVSDTTKEVIISAAPAVAFSITPVAACQGTPITFTDNSTYAGSSPIISSYWDFGDGTIITPANNDPVTHTYTGSGPYTVKHTVGISTACTGDTLSQQVTVYAPPTTSFTYPAGCLPATGMVQFNSTATSPDGQAITGHAWNFGDPASGANNVSAQPNPTHTYSSFGNYTITYSVTTANGCTKDTTVNATFNLAPTFSYPPLAAVCENTPTAVSVATATVTNGVPGAGMYKGPGTDDAGNFDPAVAGPGSHTIWFVFTTTANCIDSVSQTIIVHPKPDASFSVSAATCLPASGTVSFSYTGTAVAGQAYLWDFGDPASGANNTSAIANPSHDYTNGSFTISLTITAPNGCVRDSVLNATFNVTPALTYPALAPVCESVTGTVSIATATVTNSVTGTGVYSGPGVDGAGNFSPSIAGAGTHTITYTFTSAGNCEATATQTITVHPKPAASFTYPTTACLPASGLAQFTYNGTVEAGQTYLWNFGDPASGANNTAAIANPTHTYTNTGNYTMSVTVTNANGCSDDSVITAVLSVTPALDYPALAPVCESVPGTVSVATAVVTNAVTGTGAYNGPGVDAAGNFSPSTAGAGTHTITYTFTSGGNCTATATQTITVSPKPQSVFTVSSNICVGQQALITDNSSIPSGSINSWQWFFGDGNTATYNNNTAFNYQYADPGSYDIKLVSTSADGCTSDTARQTIVVNAVPVASFNMPASVCMPNGTATFTNTSSISDGSTLTYDWDFGDGTPASAAVHPDHVYNTAGSYTVHLAVTAAGGCSKDTSQVFSAFFDKPVAAFTVTPETLCQGADNVFTDGSSAPNSTIKTRLWLFGDGSSSSVANPTKRYTDSGRYEVKLVVTNNENCISDTFSRIITVFLQPVVDAGPSFVVPQGSAIRFQPAANDSSVTTFLWSPPSGLSDPATLRPTLIATADQMYTLTATGAGNCTATDQLSVKIVRPVKVPNAFSPNGDAINDTWLIENISDYPNAVVEVYNRYGQLVFNSTGYSKPWDGTIKGKPLPVAAYYYIIQLKNGCKPLNGSITIIR